VPTRWTKCRATGAESLVVDTAVLSMLSLARKPSRTDADEKALQHHAAAVLATHDKLRSLHAAAEHSAKVLVRTQRGSPTACCEGYSATLLALP
jgi:hypothetical protein